jgi:imidazolonepropionase-like amidohydrolase
MRNFLLPVFLLVLAHSGLAQSTPPSGHIENVAPKLVAFTNAVVHVDARTVISRATLVVRDGQVLLVGDKVKVPEGAVVRDLKGLHIWPALIDPYSDFGLPASTSAERTAEWKGARHWNGALRADAHAHVLVREDAKKAAELRKAGFGAVYTHRMDGIARGTSAALLLNGDDLRKAVVQADLAAHFSFRRGSSPDGYPNSQMGAIALMRQAILDARWMEGHPRPEQTDAVMLELAAQLKGRMVFEAHDRNELLRWAAVLEEFKLPGIIKGAGDEYARIPSIKAAGLPLIVPVALPEAYAVQDPYDAQEISYARLKHWEYAPFNPALLDSAGITFAFTTHDRKDLKEFWRDLRRMVLCGLDSARAIEAFTTDPARLFGMDDRLGALRPGMIASFLITTGHLLDEKNSIKENWVAGKRFQFEELDVARLTGTYEMNIAGSNHLLEVTDADGKLEAFIRIDGEVDSLRVKARLDRQGTLVSISFPRRRDPAAITRLSGSIHRDAGLWEGRGQLPGGSWVSWSAIRKTGRSKESAAVPDSLKERLVPVRGPLHYPLTGSGWITPPERTTTIFRNATVWTNGPAGILRDTDVLIHEGRIKAIGQRLEVNGIFPGRNKPAVVEVDARGMHLTAGIVDEHSHIAISRGVNEAGHMITSEVRIGDVVNPDDVNIYRALAGGVTTVQLLHGSANPIGGQSALIKLRWGLPADSLLIRDAPGRIKFALGENVKQSNWGAGSRFPQSRMGVEQLYYDAFHRARDLERRQQEWSSLRPRERERTPVPRRDLRLEAVLEVLRGERLISCHSYVQSEIDMLMRVADSMGFRVNTFTHILEGYKVAGRMQRHGVSASTFSDWWAYKIEVYDAIPHNAALLYLNGVNTGINSDDAEMCRRLNQEAAKTVKYGGVPEEEAWRMVTLNPARMLKLDHRIGSVEVGRDADVVLWSGNPLGIRARVMRTYVDGTCYYDADKDREHRAVIAAERDRLVRAMLNDGGQGPRKRVEREHQHLWHCDDDGDGSDHDNTVH